MVPEGVECGGTGEGAPTIEQDLHRLKVLRELGQNAYVMLYRRDRVSVLLARWANNHPPDTQWARELLVSIERGDVSQMFFGFTVLSDRWGTEDGVDVRELIKVRLYNVLPVTFPAYPQTDVGVRSTMEAYEGHKKEALEAEKAKKARKLELLRRKFELLRRV